jgi:oxygen-independent coproporphyrinogen-3 oxidase
LSIDLIAGLAGQTFASWQESITVLIETGVPHASIYMLEVDDGSRLGRELLSGGGRYHADTVPSDDTIARMYEYAIETLARAGLAQYEISNFSRPGYESAHNLRYWQRQPYLGLGLDASSMLRKSARDTERSLTGDVCRFTSTDDLKSYIEGKRPPRVDWLSPTRQHEEAWFLGLRMNRGVSISALRAEFGNQMVAMALDSVDYLAARALIAHEGDSIRLTAKGRLLSNDVFQEFLDLGVTGQPMTATVPL